jgi:hypothetical protein
MIRTRVGNTVGQKMVAVTWDALYYTTRNSNQYSVLPLRPGLATDLFPSGFSTFLLYNF